MKKHWKAIIFGVFLIVALATAFFLAPGGGGVGGESPGQILVTDAARETGSLPTGAGGNNDGSGVAIASEETPSTPSASSIPGASSTPGDASPVNTVSPTDSGADSWVTGQADGSGSSPSPSAEPGAGQPSSPPDAQQPPNQDQTQQTPQADEQQGGGESKVGDADNTGNIGDTDGEMTITLIISCATILDNMGKLPEAKAGLVPAGGIVFRTTAVFYEGESVFNVLQRETRANRIHLEFMNSPIYNSAYIEGINNIYEFDCGEGSGWMYSVDGYFPNYGSSRYTLSGGETVIWHYTCDRGADVGGGDASGSYNFG